MDALGQSLGLQDPTFRLRPLLANHHLYGLVRVGRGVDRRFAADGLENLFILPPTAYVDVDDDANPVLKSLVLGSFAAEAIVDALASGGTAVSQIEIAS